MKNLIMIIAGVVCLILVTSCGVGAKMKSYRPPKLKNYGKAIYQAYGSPILVYVIRKGTDSPFKYDDTGDYVVIYVEDGKYRMAVTDHKGRKFLRKDVSITDSTLFKNISTIDAIKWSFDSITSARLEHPEHFICHGGFDSPLLYYSDDFPDGLRVDPQPTHMYYPIPAETLKPWAMILEINSFYYKFKKAQKDHKMNITFE